MLKNILKIAFRNFIKERFYALINIAGLAMGIATTLLIASYIIHETSYDKFYNNADQLYRVNMSNIWMPGGGVMSSSVLPLADALTNDYPEIEAAMRINTPGDKIIRAAEGNDIKAFYEKNVLAADSNFFQFFNFDLAYGDPSTALIGVNKVVISSAIALKYFGTQEALGKVLLMGEEKTPLQVTGVTKEQPTNAHFNFDFLLSMYTNPNNKQFEWSWIWTQVVTYVKLRPGVDVGQLEEKFKALSPKYAAPVLRRFNMDYDEFIARKGEWSFFLQPVAAIHLYSGRIGNRLGSVSDIMYIYIFSATAIFVLLLAIINFINLSTARASARAKEVGIRKVMGSMKRQLVMQFLLESVMMTFVAALVGLGLMEFLRIVIENFLGTTFHITGWNGYGYYLALLTFVLVVGILAGLYPAFYLTAFKPSKVLKGQLTTGGNSNWFRNSLVVTQFSISISLMICTIIVYQQLDYFTTRNLGYDKENIIVVNWAEKLNDHLEAFQNDVLAHGGVIDASVSMDVIGRGNFEDLFTDESAGREQSIAMMKADEHQLRTMGLELAYGRFFEPGREADDQNVVINETTMQLFGWTGEDVIGQKIKYVGDDMDAATVIGVVKDFNFYSLHYPVGPYIFFHIDAPIWGDSRVLSVKTDGRNSQEMLSFLENKWDEMAGGAPFDYDFLDQEYKKQYSNEQQLGALFAIFTTIALFVACLGLFALASYTVGRRQKEIGIRKVLGATVSSIMFMLNGSFTKLILISILIAVPIAWYSMNVWLGGFIYKVEISWWVFFGTGLVGIVVAWLTVSFQSLKAALLNPVDTLKDE